MNELRKRQQAIQPISKRPRTFGPLPYLLVLLTLALALGACSDDADEDGSGSAGIGGVEAPSIVVDPTQLSLEQVPVGDEVIKSLTIKNVGAGTLRISKITLREEAGGEFDTNKEFFEEGDGWDFDELRLKEGDSHSIEVVYRPEDQVPDQGTILIRSNDPVNKELLIPISTQASAPEIYSPARVNFPRVAPVTPEEGEPAWRGASKITKVQNVGQAPLVISDISVEGSDRFDFSIPHITDEELDEGAPADPDNDDQVWPDELAPGDHFDLRVWFRPDDDQPVEAKLLLESNDPANPSYTVDLIGNSGAPCINITPNDQITYNQASIGQVSQKTVTLENCSANSQLKLSSVEITDDGGGVFEIADGSLPGDLPADEFVLEAGQRTSFVVNFSPLSEDVYEGNVRIKSDDPAMPSVDLPINGRGTNNACPTAVATAKIRGASGSGRTDLVAQPLATIEFDGSQSSDPDGTIERYEWTILSAPRESTEMLRPSSSATPSLYLDMVGEYKIELKVYDDQGVASCGEPAIITILSQSDNDIHIQIAWEVPGNPNSALGAGADVDLHYLHPNGSWETSWDCYWSNMNPSNWRPGTPDANPTLDVDDRDGRGPENISHSNLESGLIYKVGVHYWTDNSHGPAFVTVRISKHGVEAYVYEDKEMTKRQLWEVALIDGSTLGITEMDRMYADFP